MLRVTGNPTPEVKWYKDGDEIKAGDGIRSEALPDGTHRLIIDNCKAGDQGTYRCEAVNSAGTKSSKAPLTVIREFQPFSIRSSYIFV